MSYYEKQQDQMQQQVSEYLTVLHDREKFRALSKDTERMLREWVEKKNPVGNAEKVFALKVKGLDTWKKILALQPFSQPTPFHVLAIGDPACGKSEVAMAIQAITPTTKYEWCSGLTKAGLRLANMGGMLAKGGLPECHTGEIFLDEGEQLHTEEIGALYGAMQHYWFSEEKASLKVPVIPARDGVAMLANPEGDYWRTISPNSIKAQIPFKSTAFLTRFNLIYIVASPSVERFRAISHHQMQASIKGTEANDMNEKDVDNWKLFCNYMKNLVVNQWENPQKQEDAITEFTSAAYQQYRRHSVAVPISPRLTDGARKIATAYAKSRFDDTIRVKDTVKTLIVLAEVLSPCGLDADKCFKAVKKATKLDIGKLFEEPEEGA